MNEAVRHHRAEDDEPGGLLSGGTGDWALPPDTDDLAPGDIWETDSPGSTAAAARGCLCPMLPNDPRAGLGRLIAPDCPVHRPGLD
ncbi:MAG: hypothetical protein ACRDQ0_01870 [Pseudonocardia sp.]